MGKLTDRLKALESKIVSLESKITNLSKNTESRRAKPESKIGLREDGKRGLMPSTGTGVGKFPGNTEGIIWNDADALLVPWGQQPPTPLKGYNKHSHSEFSGGALDINTLQLVEYDFNGQNPDCQSYWNNPPQIVKDGDVDKIGLLDITFDKNSKKWLAGGIIDVEKTLLLQKDDNGEIEKDENGNEMKAVMYGTETNTQNVVWDKNAKCYRFYAVFADEE